MELLKVAGVKSYKKNMDRKPEKKQPQAFDIAFGDQQIAKQQQQHNL